MDQGTFTTSDGARIAYACEGAAQAPVLVLSNSLGTVMAMWDGQMPAFTRYRRVVRYDSRGHGGSSCPDGEYSIARLGQDAVELMAHLGVDRADVCGLSMGGMVGQWLGANAPERIAGLVLCNTSAYIGPEAWRARIASVCAGGMPSIGDAVIARWFTPQFRALNPDAVAPLRGMLMGQAPEGYIGCCAAIRDMDLRLSAPAIRAPTLIIGGTEDQATPPADSDWLAAAISGAALTMLPAAHLSNIECGVAFTNAVAGFLNRTA